MQRSSLSVEYLRPSELLEGHQPFGFSLYLKGMGLWDRDRLFSSLDRRGMLSPLLVHGNKKEGTFRIIDGFRRAEWAVSRGIAELSCLALYGLEKTGVMVLVHEAQAHVVRTAALKAGFLGFLEGNGVSRETMLRDFMPLLGLPESSHLLKNYLRVAGLSGEVLRFGHEKGFSLKKLMNLSYYRGKLVELFFASASGLSLSASLVEEMLGNINDILRRDGISPEEFFAGQDVAGLLGSDMDPREKTRRFRQMVRRLRFPGLTGIEQDMEAARQRFLSGGSFSISWDPSLENRALKVSAVVKSPEEFQCLVEDLGRRERADGIRAIFSHL